MTTRRSITLAAALLGSLASPSLLHAAFTVGDVYLVSNSLPLGGSGAGPGVFRYQPGAGVSGLWIPLPNGTFGGTLGIQPNGATYDPHRDRLLIPVLNGSVLGTVDSTGALGTIPVPSIGTQLVVAGPNGNVYLIAPTTIRYLDAFNVVHELLDMAAAPINLSVLAGMGGLGSAIYDVGTDSLLVTASVGGNTRIARLSLNATATQLDAPITTVDRDLIAGEGESVAGMSAGPNGSVYVTIDLNANGTFPLLQTINPISLTASTFASTSGFNNAAMTTGTWLSAQQLGLGLDTGQDVIRAYAAGGSGTGTIVATGASSPGGTAESARLLTIGGTINGTLPRLGDLNGDGVVNAADLAILLGAWGPCLQCSACPADLDGDCAVSAADLAILLGNWG